MKKHYWAVARREDNSIFQYNIFRSREAARYSIRGLQYPLNKIFKIVKLLLIDQ